MRIRHQTTCRNLFLIILLFTLGCGMASAVGLSSKVCDHNVLCPMIYAPVCGTDGRTYSNRCMAGRACVDVAYDGICEKPPAICQDLDEDGYSPVGGACGSKDCNDRDPVVNPKMVCSEIYDPVCGVDNKTYANSCQTLRRCVEIDHTGECLQTYECPDVDQDGYSPKGGDCGPIDCNDKDDSVRPDLICSHLFFPVCGEDGKTYSNPCHARQSCVAVAHDGKCGDEQK